MRFQESIVFISKVICLAGIFRKVLSAFPPTDQELMAKFIVEEEPLTCNLQLRS